MRKLIEFKTKNGLNICGISIGQMKHLFDRYRNYLAWFQIPLLLYTAVLTTLQYFPSLKGHLLEIMVVGFLGFFVSAGIAMFVDYKLVFQSEREFMYGGTTYFERKFNGLEKKMDDLIKK